MTSIIKNQILKHLSKFAKNLTADKINISTMRGEGEMSNLELNETVMTDLLELPAWMRITRVWCNRVTVRIHWTKLKSVPIYVSLDEVQVAMETCDELRPMATTQPAYASGGRYGFSDKVIDGMTVTINSCCVMFKSHAFEASVQVSRIVLESKSPSWQRSDLRMTRLRDPDRGEVLIFKELQWQTVKIEARSTLDQGLSPLRLITNQSHCRIVIKKKISDCSVLGCRLVLILDDLLWVLTDEQMKAALHFLDSLSGLIQKATEHSHQVKAVRKLESLPEYQAQQTQSSRRSQGNTALSRVFAKYDVVETSYHLYSDRIDLHLCDDPGEGRSCAPELEQGGALQVTFKQLELDYYPYHLAYGDRRHWVRYNESIPAQWLDQALQEFRTRLTTLLLNGGPQQHTRLARAPPHLNSTPAAAGGAAAAAAAAAGGPPAPSPHRSFVMNQLRKLMSVALVVRINDFVIYRVSTSQRKTVLKEFVMGRRTKRSLGPRPSNLIFCSPREKERMNVPGQTSSIHIEMTYFYYPGSVRFPVPPPKAMVHVNPIQVLVDPVTVLWLNAFACNLTKSLSPSGGAAPPPYLDLRLEAIMPRLVLETTQDYPLQRDRPTTLHMQTTRLLVCNYRSPDPTAPGSLAGLTKCLERLQAGEMAFGSEFPARDSDFQVVPDRLVQHTLGKDHVQPCPADVVASVADFRHGLPDQLLWEEPRDVIFLHMDPFWADFYGTSAVRHRPVPLIDAIPMSLWVYQHRNKVASASEGRVADQSALLHVPSLVSVQLNHFQYLFLLRQLERLTEMSACLTMDAERLLGAAGAGSMAVSGALPQVDVSLLMPCLLSSKDSSGGDLSVFPDSSSVTSFQEASLMQMRVDSLTEVTAAIFLSADEPPAAAAAAAVVNNATAAASPASNHTAHNSHNSHNATNHVSAGAGAGATPPRVRAVPTTLVSQPSVVAGGSPGGQLADLGAGLSSVKKGFNSFLSSIDSALKSPDDQSDTMSIMSDMSSDSDSYVLLNLEMDKAASESVDPLFVVEGALKRVPSVEIASEVTEDTHSEVSLSSAMRKRDIISALTLRLGRLEFVQQGAGNSSSLKVLLRHLSAEQCAAIGWDEFQAKFQLRTKGWQGLDVATAPCNIRMRMDSTFIPVANQRHHKINVLEQVKSELEVRASDLELSLLMSTVANLTDFIEDEILPVPLPMQLHLERLKLRLTEDRPPNNITSPGVVPPLDVAIPALRVSRDETGVFTVHQTSDGAGGSGSSMAAEAGSRVDVSSSFNNPNGGEGGSAAAAELARLKQRCQLLENQLEQRRGAEERLQYLAVVETRCREAEDEVQGLREEKESLMKTLRYLQEEFLRLDRQHNRRADAN